jgi:hypothetical protein
MTGQVQEVIDEPTQFLPRQGTRARLGLLTPAAQAVDDQYRFRCDRFDELDLLWRVPAVNVGLGDDKPAKEAGLKEQGEEQGIRWDRICPVPGWHAQAIGRQHHLLTCGEAGKHRFVDKI